MNERKILLFILFVVIYCLYSIHMWFTKETEISILENEIEIKETVTPETEIEPEILIQNKSEEIKEEVKTKVIPLVLKNACSVLQVFTEKPSPLRKTKPEKMDPDTNSITVIGITVFLVVLALNALLDVLKVKEEERAQRKLNPDGVRRQSLAEFANKKTLRRETSRFGMQLFQIAESASSANENKDRRRTRPYTRGDSTNSYLSDKNSRMEGSAPASIADTSEPKLVKRQSIAKLFGARPVPMVRRSSFPALPLNPDVQAAMLGHRQPSVDSDDEDGRGRRVRLIRRF